MSRERAIEALEKSGICGDYKKAIKDVINAYADYAEPTQPKLEVGDIVRAKGNIDGRYFAGKLGIIRSLSDGVHRVSVGIEFFEKSIYCHSLNGLVPHLTGRWSHDFNEIEFVTKGGK